MNELTAAPLIDTPLVALHRQAGANMGGWFGCALPSDFGDPRTEQQFAREAVALVDKNYRSYLSLTGPDRVRYLNAILTNNVKDLPENRGNLSLLLNPQGRILAEIETHAFAERLLCVSYVTIREWLIEWLDKYIIMDDVTLTDDSARYGTLALEGPQAARVIQDLIGLDILPMAELESAEIAHLRPPLGNPEFAAQILSPCRIVKRSPGGVPGAEFLLARAGLEPTWRLLSEAVSKHGGGPIGYTALSAQRLAQGIPWFGYDFDGKYIPHEAGLQESHISYTKGCYTGQEIVERVRSRGHVNRQRVYLLFAGPDIPPTGTPLTIGGKEVGHVTRAAQNFYPPAIIGMGYVRGESGALGSTLEWPGGTATVVKFPEALEPVINKK